MRAALVSAMSLLVLWSPGASAIEPALESGSPARTASTLVVWQEVDDAAVRVYAAKLDGEDRVSVFRQNAPGLIGSMTLSPDATQVALMPLNFKTNRTRLVIADIDGERSVDLLDRVRPFLNADRPGWSPNGRRIVFEGEVREAGKRRLFLWSIRRDGKQLRKLAAVRQDSEYSPGDVTAWTRKGIYFESDGNLMRLHKGHVREALPRTGRVLLSGDGRWLVLSRYRNLKTSLWRMRPDGSDLERLISRINPDDATQFVYVIGPNGDGTRLLSAVESYSGEPARVVNHPISRLPTDDDPVLAFVSGSAVWN